MSAAVDNAELMLICVSLKYKESASELRNCVPAAQRLTQTLLQIAVWRPTTGTSRRSR